MAKSWGYGGYTKSIVDNPGYRAGQWIGFGPSAEVAGGMQNLATQYQQQYGEAKAANEARYQQMLQLQQQGTQQQRTELQSQYGQMLDVAGQTTGQRAADIRSTYGQQQSGMMQQLARQGMAGTTIAPTMGMGIQREQQSALNRLADEMQGTKLGLMERQAGAVGGLAERGQQQRLGIMERREDAYPDAGSLQSILAGIGTSYGDQQGIPALIRLFN